MTRPSVLPALFCLLLGGVLLLATRADAKPAEHHNERAPIIDYVDIVGDRTGVRRTPAAVTNQDTLWIADWTFDGAVCDNSGWLRVDNRILSDGFNHWSIAPNGGGGDGNQGTRIDLSGIGNIAGQHALVGEHDLCWEGDGYGNDWYSAIKFIYQGGGSTYLSFDYLLDTEGGFDFLQVETDSACASFARVDYSIDPMTAAASFRVLEFSVSGFDTMAATTTADSVLLTDYGPGVHCAYIAFVADDAFSPQDGLQPSFLQVAAAIDNIVLEGHNSGAEDFEDGMLNGLPATTFANIQDTTPFGEWSRLFSHITDNDLCSENSTCAWLNTDDTTPTVANDPSVAFAPGQFVIRNWLDDIQHSPWVSLVTTPGASGTVLSFRRYPGNFFSTSRVVQNWSVRGKAMIDNTDSPTPGDSIECILPWGHAFQWNSLSTFRWVTSIFDMESHFDPSAREIQLRFRASDWQYIANASPPTPFIPGPGPYWDRVRIGRRILTGPVMNEGIDARTQGQDCFATEPTVNSGTPNWKPSTDRFGSAAFSRGSELAI